MSKANDDESRDDTVRLRLAREFVARVLRAWINTFLSEGEPRLEEVTISTIVPGIRVGDICLALTGQFGRDFNWPEARDITFAEFMQAIKREMFPMAA